MVGVRTPYVCIPSLVSETQFYKPKLMSFQFNPIHSSSFSRIHQKTSSKSKLFTTISSSPSSVPTVTPEPELEVDSQGEKFDWYAQWYPIMLVCDLDKRVPHAKRVMGLDIVLWWDRNENTWKVFGDACPHRLAPLSEGRIDQWGRLQCVYHGWCFNGSGDCKFIPQASPDGPPVISPQNSIQL
jgi:nitrite reductase/ring-hydroxylating ferredoxin subunit